MHVFIKGGNATYLFLEPKNERVDFKYLTPRTLKLYNSQKNLLEESCVDKQTNKILRQSFLEKFKPSVFEEEKYTRRLLTKEEIEQYMRIIVVHLKIPGQRVQHISLAKFIDIYTEEKYGKEPEYELFDKARQERINNGTYNASNVINIYHPDGGFKSELAKLFGFQYSPDVSSVMLYKHYGLIIASYNNLLVYNDKDNKFLRVVKEKDIVENRDQYDCIDYKIALVVALDYNWRGQFRSFLESEKSEKRVNKKSLNKQFIDYNGTEYSSINNNINPDDYNYVPVNNLTPITPTPKKRPDVTICEDNSNSTPNKIQKLISVHDITIPKGLQEKNTKAPTNYSIVEILKDTKITPCIG